MKYDATMMGFPTRGGTRGVMDMSYDNSTLLIGNNDGTFIASHRTSNILSQQQKWVLVRAQKKLHPAEE